MYQRTGYMDQLQHIHAFLGHLLFHSYNTSVTRMTVALCELQFGNH